MTSYPKHVWEQLKGKSLSDIVRAMERDGFVADFDRPDAKGHRGAVLAYIRARDGQRVTIHHHPQITYGPRVQKAILDEIAWTEADMRRLKLIK